MPAERTYSERLGYTFTLLIIILGCIASYLDSSLGLSLYIYSITLNFILGVCTLPFFGYGFRYILDLFMVYMAFVHKEHVETTYLPIHVHSF